MTTDQPTPTSSLEEAWKTHLEGIHGVEAMRTEDTDWERDRLAIEAAARAEVIREVEALRTALVIARSSLVSHRDYCAKEKYVGSADIIQGDIWLVDEALGINTDAAEYSDASFDACLRALSQGGEGKSDG